MLSSTSYTNPVQRRLGPGFTGAKDAEKRSSTLTTAHFRHKITINTITRRDAFYGALS
jgi:hypothetical protein